MRYTYAGRTVTPDQLARIAEVQATARRRHSAISRQRRDQLAFAMRGLPAAPTPGQLADHTAAVRRIRIDGSWDAVLVEDHAVTDICDILGIPSPAAIRTTAAYRSPDLDPIVAIRDALALEPLPPDTWVNVFMRDPQAYATAHGLPLEEVETDAKRRAYSWSRDHLDRELALARRGHHRGALVQRGLRHYRRVPEPGACRYCRDIATRIYYTEHLLPAHDHCRCGSLPATERDAPATPSTAPPAYTITQNPHYGPIIEAA